MQWQQEGAPVEGRSSEPDIRDPDGRRSERTCDAPTIDAPEGATALMEMTTWVLRLVESHGGV